LLLRILPLLFLTLTCFGGEKDDPIAVWNRHKVGLYKAAKAYVSEFSDKKTLKKFQDNLAERLETRSLETVALDWFFDNQQDLEDRIPSKIVTACFYFMVFVETKTPPPLKMRENITDENLRQLRDYLEGCVSSVKDGKT